MKGLDRHSITVFRRVFQPTGGCKLVHDDLVTGPFGQSIGTAFIRAMESGSGSLISISRGIGKLSVTIAMILHYLINILRLSHEVTRDVLSQLFIQHTVHRFFICLRRGPPTVIRAKLIQLLQHAEILAVGRHIIIVVVDLDP